MTRATFKTIGRKNLARSIKRAIGRPRSGKNLRLGAAMSMLFAAVRSELRRLYAKAAR